MSGRNLLRYTVDLTIFGPVQSTEISNRSSAAEEKQKISFLWKEEKDLIMRGRIGYIEKMKGIHRIFQM